MHWFRKARYAVALLVILFTGIGFATRIGEHSAPYVVTVYFMLAGMFVLTVGIAYADHSVTEWLS
jgi:predicted RND superfamily exporter protein